MELKGADRRVLRSLGHSLKATVMVGHEGVTKAVVTSLDQALGSRELVKVKLLETCPQDRDEASRTLADGTGGQCVQTLGRTLLFFRRHPDRPRISIPSDPVRSTS